MTVRAVGYCRGTAGSDVMADQREVIEGCCKAKGYDLIRMFEDGERGDRSQFAEVIDDARKGKIDVVVVTTIDRVSRDRVKVDRYVSELGISGVRIEAASVLGGKSGVRKGAKGPLFGLENAILHEKELKE